eukprot:12245526-Alexandrium_andersonii.AAC.1
MRGGRTAVGSTVPDRSASVREGGDVELPPALPSLFSSFSTETQQLPASGAAPSVTAPPEAAAASSSSSAGPAGAAPAGERPPPPAEAPPAAP